MNRQHINSLIGVLLGARLEQLGLITYTYYLTIKILYVNAILNNSKVQGEHIRNFLEV